MFKTLCLKQFSIRLLTVRMLLTLLASPVVLNVHAQSTISDAVAVNDFGGLSPDIRPNSEFSSSTASTKSIASTKGDQTELSNGGMVEPIPANGVAIRDNFPQPVPLQMQQAKKVAKPVTMRVRTDTNVVYRSYGPTTTETHTETFPTKLYSGSSEGSQTYKLVPDAE